MISDGVMDITSLKHKNNIKKKLRHIFFIKPILKFFRGYVLDIGCGDGEYIENYKGRSLGIDANENNIYFCQKIGLNVITADANSFNKPETFDTVLLSHVLEHLSLPQKVLENSYISTKTGGCILIIVPTYKGFVSGLNDLVGHKNYISEQYLDHYLIDQLGCKKIYSKKFPICEFGPYQELRLIYLKCPNGNNSGQCA
jgi:2-polyprenyl-3-methyl-5-hydroxy-6-metoxy-1,4-benzoquinol methylase